jgi:hypothetical protein
VALGRELQRSGGVAFGHLGQDAFLVLELGVGIVGALDVGPQEAGERDGLAARREQGLTTVGRRRPRADRRRDSPRASVIWEAMVRCQISS